MVPTQASLSQKDPEQWKQREAGVLALGAVSDGCLDGLLPLLPQVSATEKMAGASTRGV